MEISGLRIHVAHLRKVLGRFCTKREINDQYSGDVQKKKPSRNKKALTQLSP